MPETTLSVYETPDWGARLAGVARAHRDAQGELFVNEVHVEGITVKGLFSILSCADGSTPVVLTSFLRLVPDPRHSKQRGLALPAPMSR